MLSQLKTTLKLALFMALIASTAHAQTQNIDVTLTWAPNPLKNETGFRIYQCVNQACTPNENISGDLAPGTVKYVDHIFNDPGLRVICYQGEYFNSAGTAKGPVGCITTPAVTVPPQAPGPFSFDVKVILAGLSRIPGSTNGWTDGLYSWFGPPACDQGWLLSPGSPAIDAGELIPGFHCPQPGPSLAGCVEWAGKAPDIGACEYIPAA